MECGDDKMESEGKCVPKPRKVKTIAKSEPVEKLIRGAARNPSAHREIGRQVYSGWKWTILWNVRVLVSW